MRTINTLRQLFFVALLASSQAATVHAVPASSVTKAPEASVTEAQYAKVNINTAEVDGLIKLLGIGQSKAEAIVKYRSKFGLFKTREDLLAVDGIGQATLSKNRDRIDLE